MRLFGSFTQTVLNVKFNNKFLNVREETQNTLKLSILKYVI